MTTLRKTFTPPLFIIVCHSFALQTNDKCYKSVRMTNRDKQGGLNRGGVGYIILFFLIFSVFKIKPPTSPPAQTPLFITIYHPHKIITIITNLERERMTNRDKQGGCAGETPLFITFITLRKTNNQGLKGGTNV